MGSDTVGCWILHTPKLHRVRLGVYDARLGWRAHRGGLLCVGHGRWRQDSDGLAHTGMMSVHGFCGLCPCLVPCMAGVCVSDYLNGAECGRWRTWVRVRRRMHILWCAVVGRAVLRTPTPPGWIHSVGGLVDEDGWHALLSNNVTAFVH